MKIFIQGVFMKTIAKITALAFFIAGSSVFANSFEVKAGSSSADAADKWGVDAAIGINFDLNPYFSVGVETGIQWISWDFATGATSGTGTLSSTETVSFDAYNVPIMLNPRFKMPLGGDDFGGGTSLIPYLSLGIGYSVMSGVTTYPDSWKEAYPTIYKDKTDTYSGLIFQPMIGVMIPLGGGGEFSSAADTGMKIILEAGYRYNEVEKDSYKIKMSGLVVRAGTNFAF